MAFIRNYHIDSVLVWMLNRTGKNVLTPDEVENLVICIGWNTPEFLEMRQMPPPPDDFDYVEHCISVGGYKLVDRPPEPASEESDPEN